MAGNRYTWTYDASSITLALTIGGQMRFAWPLLVALVCVNATAAPVFVNNFSFETVPPGGFPFGCGAGCDYNMDGVIPGWTTVNLSGAASGEFQPGVSAGNTTYFDSIPDGTTIAYTNDGTISQTVGTVTLAGVSYKLLVDIGLRKDLTNILGTAQLLIGSTSVLATGIAPVPGSFATFSAIYTSSPADIGKAITIQLAAIGAQGDFDNVTLDASPKGVPEPAAVALAGLGLAGIALIRRGLLR